MKSTPYSKRQVLPRCLSLASVSRVSKTSWMFRRAFRPRLSCRCRCSHLWPEREPSPQTTLWCSTSRTRETFWSTKWEWCSISLASSHQAGTWTSMIWICINSRCSRIRIVGRLTSKLIFQWCRASVTTRWIFRTIACSRCHHQHSNSCLITKCNKAICWVRNQLATFTLKGICRAIKANNRWLDGRG